LNAASHDRRPLWLAPAARRRGAWLRLLPPHPACARDERRDRSRARSPDGTLALMFFFSNRLGCLTSLLISVVGTLLLLLVLGVINLD
jgi:hypothetical protein